ncbi:unnamed protein product [Spirodela intermedia]|uniref:Uncharacterized protein n=2 Tax=Spirodela intermedia TaxID=51605 RepID=A0A7I8LEU5_SPIIN|nr:unnamed protein product [Spirodela intermedia]CAA6671107.1 unnamed protein product [Spirodela intermedia]CAA7408216.1 unnamed protein product [Spirodela intermedia]
MDWWQKVVFPVKRVWIVVAARVKVSRKTGPAILKLHDDVQTCGYEDVQVMWEMLRTEMEISHAAQRKRSFWKLFLWSDPAAADRQHHRH